MVVFTKDGVFTPSLLQQNLLTSGIEVLGVTGTDTGVQIICQDGTVKANVDAVVAAYPTPIPLEDAATRNLVEAVKAVVSAPDFAHAQSNLQALVAAQSQPQQTPPQKA